MPITLRPGASAAWLDELTSGLEDVGSLQQLLAWGGPDDLALRIEEIVTQDEYTHDILVPWRADHWLVFDAT